MLLISLSQSLSLSLYPATLFTSLYPSPPAFPFSLCLFLSPSILLYLLLQLSPDSLPPPIHPFSSPHFIMAFYPTTPAASTCSPSLFFSLSAPYTSPFHCSFAFFSAYPPSTYTSFLFTPLSSSLPMPCPISLHSVRLPFTLHPVSPSLHKVRLCSCLHA